MLWVSCLDWSTNVEYKGLYIYTNIDQYFIILSSEAKAVSTTYNLEATKSSNNGKYSLLSFNSPLTASMFL